MNTPSASQDALLARLQRCTVRERLRLYSELRGGKALSPERLHGIEKQIERSEAAVTERAKLLPNVRYPETLPVAMRAAEIVQAMRDNQVLIIAGETGSGKTTQLPKMLLEAGCGVCGKIACTQPRRVAALSVSRRVAEELGVEWGRQVGAKIRFTDRTNQDTLVKFATDGMLLSEVQNDPLLSEYDAVIVDEAHERSLNIDFLLGYLNQLRHKRPDLKIVITSATIDTEAFSKAFGGAPVIEVSGRSYPVEVFYRPLDEAKEDAGEATYIEAAVGAVQDICSMNGPGDVLVFLPGERDIHEVINALGDMRLGGAELLPLFGRLSAADQQRIFAPAQKRKIIVATNIAETSITVPGIRYVVDAGLARISRYNSATRTQRLPVEPVSRSSADQRKGRCGRVAEGICIRLYSEQDYEGRPRYTEPEIRRANLAAVILRMKAARLGEVESFPFIDPPQERAIRAGYELLQDLGALDEGHNLTGLGRRLARLPVDPTVARMLLEAVKEGCLKEVLVIAAGLSIQDPRERPQEARDAADLMHKRFDDQRSDFLALLNIWKAYDTEAERLSQKQLRKFCKSHFLSYLRMREWMDIHSQLSQTMKEMGEYREAGSDAEYFSIHRALLSGLLGNIARRDEGNHFTATHNRAAMLFPGSSLFDKKSAKDERKKNKGQMKPSGVSGARTPAWIMAAQWMETTRLYARTCAAIESPWILQLGAHLIRHTHEAPTWDERGQRAVCTEKSFLYGLEINRRRVNLAPLKPAEATELFIRNGLVEGGVTEVMPFLEANRELREKVEERQTRLRRGQLWSMDDRLFNFYAERLPSGIGSVPDLRKFIKAEHGGKDEFLRLSETDLLDPADENVLENFPDAVDVGGEKLPLSYSYKPGEEDDGATLSVPLAQFDALQPGMLDWMVPGYIEQRVEALLRGLPKDIRKALFPIAEKTAAILAKLSPSPLPLTEQLSRVMWEQFQIRVRPQDWPHEDIPAHLRPRVQVVDTEQKVIAAERDWKKLQETYSARIAERKAAMREEPDELKVWTEARRKFERGGLTAWSFPDQPETIVLTEVAGVPMEAWPGLELERDKAPHTPAKGAKATPPPPASNAKSGRPIATLSDLALLSSSGLPAKAPAAPTGSVSLKLFHSRTEALAASGPAFQKLAETALGRDMAWFERDLKRELGRAGPDIATLMPMERFHADAIAMLLRAILRPEAAKLLPLKKTVFDAIIKDSATRLRGLPQKFTDLLADIFEQRRAILLHKAPYAGMREELDALLPANFMAITPLSRLEQFPRYLKAMLARAEQARIDRVKYAKKLDRVRPYAEALYKLATRKRNTPQQLFRIEDLRWMLEEFKVSVFAQNLGTNGPVSEKRLDELIAGIEQ
ncbi:MAG: ATP-dependent RNA helicase HrpA [Opitutales bacterium]|nr:ATP-dependent RNA helicase HrpA [Opitutales bacterium]